MRWLILALTTISLVACDVSQTPPPGTEPGLNSKTLGSPETARKFAKVVGAVQPVAVQECQRRTAGINCDFRIFVDGNPRADPNAFQTLDDSGRPVLTFTVSLIEAVRNTDELAFVMGHEASHHIAGHLARQQQNADAAAAVFAGLAELTGGTDKDVADAQELGAAVGARTYSKEFELEADALGTIITYRAGYDPMVGAQFFARIPDPGDRFLGTHPPNAARIETVERTNARLRAGG